MEFSTRETQLAFAMVAVIADGAGLAILQSKENPQSQCPVACQSKRNFPTDKPAKISMAWNVGLTALIVAGRGHLVRPRNHRELHAVAMQVRLRKSSLVASVPRLQMAFAGLIVKSAVGHGRPLIYRAPTARLQTADVKTGEFEPI